MLSSANKARKALCLFFCKWDLEGYMCTFCYFCLNIDVVAIVAFYHDSDFQVC